MLVNDGIESGNRCGLTVGNRLRDALNWIRSTGAHTITHSSLKASTLYMSSKRLEKAEKLLWKGKTDEALQEFLSVLREDPRNDVARENAADLCMSLHRNADAAALLGELFERQAESGSTPKAVITYKKLARVANPTVDQTLRFAQLAERSSRKEAIEAYELAVKVFANSRRKKDEFTAVKRLAALDPTPGNIEREGNLAAELREEKHASHCFMQLGKMAEEQGGDGFGWYERAYVHASTEPPVAIHYARGLLAKGDSARAVRVLEPIAKQKDLSAEVRGLYSQALLAEKRPLDAGPHIWKLFLHDPNRLAEVGALIGTLIETGKEREALEVTRGLEDYETKTGKRRDFVSFIHVIVEKHPVGIQFSEYLVGIYNSANREHDYGDTLVRLFELYFADRNYIKAAEALDRAADVDPYIKGHKDRLEMLRGKIDGGRWNAIANRLQSVVEVQPEVQKSSAAAEKLAGGAEPTVLQDFILQAEIFLQYQMRAKAIERLERITKIFPHEEERNDKLRLLFMNAGFTPKYDKKAAAMAGPPLPGGLAPPAPPLSARATDEGAVDNFARVTEITRNIYRQSNVKGVLFATVNDVGRHWNASRCVAGLCSPGKPPSAALEYCAPGMPQSEVMHIVKLINGVQKLSVQHGAVMIENVPTAQELASLKSIIDTLGVKSLLGIPLIDGEEHVGILILEQCDSQREWRTNDVMVLKTIADQIVLAVNNAKLRNLVKTLAVTDEKSGLLKRSSYIDVLLAEARRSVQQNSLFTVMLMNFGKGSALVKEISEATVENMMQSVGQTVCSHIRQNDVAVRYDRTTIALMLADTNEKNGFFVVDKLRKVFTDVKIPNTDRVMPMTVGIAEAAALSKFDAVDIVTEVINRAETALEAALDKGANSAHSIAPNLEPAEVA
jgi:GGDEF domain-containing protein/tetratricopeptide (TPR) repeat protein